MIKNHQIIVIDDSPENVFSFIERMPNKFPVYGIMEIRPVLFIRMLLVDGYKMAIRTSKYPKTQSDLILKVGDSLGPFTLAESVYPEKYWFNLKSFFFNCKTGYTIHRDGLKTELAFELIAENPALREKIWWFFVKPIHTLLSRKSLKEIKKRLKYAK